jgi:putative transposase
MSDDRYYNAKELAGLVGLPGTVQGVIAKAARENWPARKRAGKGGGNEYPETCLPKTTQKALQDQRVQAILADTSHIKPLVEADPMAYMSLTDRQRHVNDARMGVLAEVERMMRDGRLSKESAIHTLLGMAKTGTLEAFKLNILKTALDGRGGKAETPSVRTIKRWFADRGDLAPKRNKKNLTHPAWAADFLACYRQPSKPSISMAYEEFCANWAGTPPSIDAVRRYLRKLPEIELQKHRMGPRELKSLKPFVRRTFENLWPNDVWSADGHTFDAEVQHPLHGQPFRPEITGIIDIGTRYMVGFSVTLKESALTTADALRNACERSGIPAIFYVDNGSGYANDLLKNESTGILSRLGIEVKHSLPYNSQARGVIERSHRTIWVSLAKTLPSYMGADMDREAKQKFFKESRRGDKNGVTRLPIGWRDFMNLCEDAVNSYNHRPHSSLPKAQGRHMSPAEYRAMKMQTIVGYEHHEVNAEEAASLFRPRETRKVIRGEVSLFSNRYASNALTDYHDQEVQVGYDVHDAQSVWIYDENGEFVCRAEFKGNDKDYFPTPVVVQSRNKRTKGRLRNNDKQREEIIAENKGAMALEAIPVNELPGMRVTAQKVEEKRQVEVAATSPPSDQPRERYLFWRDLDERAKAGEEIPEAFRPFYQAFPNTANWRSWNAFYNGELLAARS